MGNLTSTLSWRSAPAPLFSKQNLPRKMQWLDLGLKLLVPVLLLVFLAISLQLGSLTVYFRLLNRQSYASLVPALGAAYTLAVLLFQVFRTILWARYKPYPLSPSLPSVTVIIPAYNEGAMVEKAIYSVIASEYPADRLKIICIDDGSQDDTRCQSWPCPTNLGDYQPTPLIAQNHGNFRFS